MPRRKRIVDDIDEETIDEAQDDVAESTTKHSFKKHDYGAQRIKAKAGRSWKSLKQIIAAENYGDVPPNIPTYVSIEAGPSVMPLKKYCDITGYEAKYTDPRTKLHYSSSSMYPLIQGMPSDMIHGYLSLRNANVSIK